MHCNNMLSSVNHCGCGRAINITYFECLCVCGLCGCLYFCFSFPACKSLPFSAVLYSTLWPVCLYLILPHYHIKGKTFGKKFIEHIMCFDSVYKFVRNIFHSKNFSVKIITNVRRSSCKASVILVRF